jgi:Ca-activated chloride channel family protein
VNRFSVAVPLVTATLLAGVAVSTQRPSPGAARPAHQAPAFRSGVDLVSLSVTVTGSDNRYVVDLDPSEVSIYEDGIQQEISFFNRGRRPIVVSMLLDSSASMEHQMPTLQAAATNFVRRLTPSDRAQIVDFDGQVHIRQPFTANRRELETAIHEVVAGGSTALYTAVYVALREMQKVQATTEEDAPRQALIVFSDGEDTSSVVVFDDVLDLTKRSDTTIYTIALRGPDGGPRGFRHGEFVMRSLAQETGGRTFFPQRIEDLSGAYQQISDELASQYSLGYTSKNPKRDGAWRRLTVRVLRPGLTARAKAGYYAPTR